MVSHIFLKVVYSLIPIVLGIEVSFGIIDTEVLEEIPVIVSLQQALRSLIARLIISGILLSDVEPLADHLNDLLIQTGEFPLQLDILLLRLLHLVLTLIELLPDPPDIPINVDEILQSIAESAISEDYQVISPKCPEDISDFHLCMTARDLGC